MRLFWGWWKRPEPQNYKTLAVASLPVLKPCVLIYLENLCDSLTEMELRIDIFRARKHGLVFRSTCYFFRGLEIQSQHLH